MEAIKDQSATDVKINSASSKLRYPLRSAIKPIKGDNLAKSPASKRSRSNVSKSVSVLDLSSKEKSAKPPRRLSIPMKSAISPIPRSIGTITPISESRLKRSTPGQGKSGTPVSDVSKSMSRPKFCAISSASYWLSQIKLSESAAKHSISIGFFKLALESGCEPLQRMRDELKNYARRHSLVELREPVKELLKSYDISEDVEQLQVSGTISQAPEYGTRSSDKDVNSSTTTGAKKFKPKSLNSESFQGSSIAEMAKKEINQKRLPTNKNNGPSKASSGNLKSVTNVGGANLQKKPEKLIRQQGIKEKAKLKNEGKNYVADEDPIEPLAAEKKEQEDKENMDAEQMEENNSTEVK